MAFSLEEYFSINIFFIMFRETLECVIIVSVLLAFLEQNFELVDVVSVASTALSPAQQNAGLYRKLRLQVWLGALCGISLCLLVGGLFIVAFYLMDIDLWSRSEHYWEGVFSILAAVIISVMGFGMLQLNKLEKKWHIKISRIFGIASKTNTEYERSEEHLYQSRATLNQRNAVYRFFTNLGFSLHKLRSRFKRFTAKHTLFILPFVTTLRECMESILFIGGIGVTEPAQTYALSIVLGISVGASIGILLYKSGTSSVSTQKFMVYSTSFLYIISAGLMSKGVWQFELAKFIDKCGGLDVSEVGSGPGSYDVDNNVWHVNCCNGETDGPWMIFTAIFGWTNSATYGSVISYVIYWLVISGAFYALKFENKNGFLPWVPYKWQLKRIKKNFALMWNLQNSDIVQADDHKIDSPHRIFEDSQTRLLEAGY